MTERNDYDRLIKILSVRWKQVQKKRSEGRLISFRLGVAKQLELNQVTQELFSKVVRFNQIMVKLRYVYIWDEAGWTGSGCLCV